MSSMDANEDFTEKDPTALSEADITAADTLGGAGRRIDNSIKDPSHWKTGNDPATGAQIQFATTLAEESGDDPNKVRHMTKAEASQYIQDHIDKAPSKEELRSRYDDVIRHHNKNEESKDEQ